MAKKLITEADILQKLTRQIMRYERYMDGLNGVDPQAMSAYIHLLKTVVKLCRPADPAREYAAGKIADILFQEYGIKYDRE